MLLSGHVQLPWCRCSEWRVGFYLVFSGGARRKGVEGIWGRVLRVCPGKQCLEGKTMEVEERREVRTSVGLKGQGKGTSCWKGNTLGRWVVGVGEWGV